MSEYQYYDFQALDRPLSAEEQRQVRALSTRATISATRFVNVYHYGDFKGDPRALMASFYDAFVYVANWGTHWCMLRLPTSLLDPDIALRYCWSDVAELHVKGANVILEFRSGDESGEDWTETGEEFMTPLALVRDSLANGDHRALYLAWLAGIRNTEGAGDADYDDDEDMEESGPIEESDEDSARGDEIEPPVPAGLRALSAPLKAFAAFLRLDDDLLAVAAEVSPPLRASGPTADDLARWAAALPDQEKTGVLVRLVAGAEPPQHLRGELLRRFREEQARLNPAAPAEADRGRTVRALLAAADARAETRRRDEAERAAKEQARKQREAAARRAEYLEQLAGREESVWREVAALLDTKRPKDYDQATTLLCDLRDLATRQRATAAFNARFAQLRAQHSKKPSLLERFDRAKL